MSIELPAGGLPFTLYARAQYALFIQILFGVLSFILAFWFYHEHQMAFYAFMKILAALSLLIASANLINAGLRWKSLSHSHFFTTAKIIDVTRSVKNPGCRTYKVSFSDPEGVRREGTIKSEHWEKLAYAEGDEITVLYDPLNPKIITNYSAYESLK
jgi:hypothetical protein